MGQFYNLHFPYFFPFEFIDYVENMYYTLGQLVYFAQTINLIWYR